MRTYKEIFCSVPFIILLIFVAVADCGASEKELAAKIIELSTNAKYEQALEQTDEFISKYKNISFGYAAKGNVLANMYRIEEAIQYYKEALQYITDRVKKGITCENIANNYIRLNNFDDAINYYRLAIEADNRLFASSMMGLSQAYMLKGDMDLALASYKKACKRLDESDARLREAQDANKGRVFMMAAWIAFQLGNNDEALEYAKKGKDLSNTDKARLVFASYLARVGNKKKALREFWGININNCSAGALASFYLLVDDDKNAIKYFNISYAELKTSEQIKFWKLSFKRDAMYPHDDWSKARNQGWFKAKIQSD
jgi:tetratricopeptide (TPR) repeat protein